MFKAYYRLTKPGIIYGNALTAAAGFLLASVHHGHLYVWLFLALIIGISLVIASACVFNNYIDRDIDKAMARTKNRALAKQSISGLSALLYASVLGVVGALILLGYTNLLTFLIALLGFVVYVVLYGITKRRSVHGTLVGSISGAVPVVAGYTAVTNHFDGAALLIGLMLVFWQMPHFYAIALYRLNDYKAAKIPVLPAKKGPQTTKVYIVLYTAAFAVTAPLLTLFGYTGYCYLALMILVGFYWLWLGIQGLTVTDTVKWGRQMFLFSLLVILVVSVLLPLGAWLP